MAAKKPNSLKARFWKRAHHRPGTAPGTLVAHPEAPPPVIRRISYGPGGAVDEEVTDLRGLLAAMEEWPVNWVNVDGLGDAQVIEQLGEIFGLHRLALEDVLNVHQRPKVETYGEEVFLVMRMAHLGERLRTEQIALFLGRNYVLTFQETAGDCFDPVRERIRGGRPGIRGGGPGYLAYALFDAVVDHYFPVLEAYGERLEDLEALIADRPDQGVLARVFQTKHDLLSLRRAIWPQREAAGTLYREPLPQITDETRTYLRDCYDHAVQLLDLAETYRDIGAGLMDFYHSNLSQRMNEVMKVLTIIATIFIPLGFIAGVYGMNFDPGRSPWNMPELGWRLGYPFALGLMAASAVGLLLYFRRKGWIGRARARSGGKDGTEG